MIPHIFVYGMSRSGTTLAATILDSHPDVSMGYELMPKGISDAADASRAIRATGTTDATECEAALRAQGADFYANLVVRANRCLVPPSELVTILDDFAARGRRDLTSLEERTAVALALARAKSGKEGTAASGFKLNSPRIGAFDKILDRGAAYVFTMRDPRDVWRSHVEKGFDRTVDEVATIWNNYLVRFEKFASKHGDRCHVLRYEDLVSRPGEALDAMCSAIGLPRDPAMDHFYESKASVHTAGHSNIAELQQDFFTSSVGRWRESVPHEEVQVIEEACRRGMGDHGYELSSGIGFRFRPEEKRRRVKWLNHKRTHFADEHARLLLSATEAFPHRTWAEATSPGADVPDEILVIRHDIDQDIDNAAAMARWEAEHGIRATYCVLHTAKYYGRHRAGRVIAHSENMVERCLEIQELGHEMSLHNNAVTAGLRSGTDPYEVLAEELDYLRSRGLDIRGTSGHGERLCRTVGYVNQELFKECVLPANGGPRTLRHEGHEVTIGTRSMSEFGLTYEGYDLPRDLYVSDSGGRLKVVTDTEGRGGLRRSEMSTPPPYQRVIGILTHPVWWDFDREAPPGRPDTSLAALAARFGVELSGSTPPVA